MHCFLNSSRVPISNGRGLNFSHLLLDDFYKASSYFKRGEAYSISNASAS